MKVILRHNVEHLGIPGSVVEVAPGYARNFLIPRAYAIPATKANLKAFEHEKRMIEAKHVKHRKEAEQLKAKLEHVSVSIAKKVGEQDKLFGSVTTQDIEQALLAEGFSISKKDIQLEHPIKELGVYTVPVRIFDDVIANTKVWVVKE